MNKNIRGFAPILVLVIVGILTVAAYLFTNSKMTSLVPSPTPIFVSKTYVNEEYGFSLEFPAAFNSRKTNEGKDEISVLSAESIIIRISSTSIKICNLALNANCNSYNYELVKEQSYPNADFKVYDQLTRLGDPCGPFHTKECEEKYKFTYIIRVWEYKLADNAFLQAELQNDYSQENPKETLQGEEVMNQILSTFKFIE